MSQGPCNFIHGWPPPTQINARFYPDIGDWHVVAWQRHHHALWLDRADERVRAETRKINADYRARMAARRTGAVHQGELPEAAE